MTRPLATPTEAHRGWHPVHLRVNITYYYLSIQQKRSLSNIELLLYSAPKIDLPLEL